MEMTLSDGSIKTFEVCIIYACVGIAIHPVRGIIIVLSVMIVW